MERMGSHNPHPEDSARWREGEETVFGRRNSCEGGKGALARRGIKASWVLVVVVAASSMVLAACGGSSPTSTSGKRETVKIGVPFSLSGAGAFAGVPEQQAAKVAFEELNAKYPNLNFVPVWKDDATDQGTGIDVTNELITQDQVDAIAGYTASNVCQAALPIAQQAKVPAIAADCVVPGLTKIGNYIFRDVVPYNDFLVSMIGTLKKDNPNLKTAAIIYTTANPVFASEDRDMEKEFKKVGIKLVAFETVTSASTSDFSAQMTRIAAAKPDILAVMLEGGQSGPAIVQARQAGMTNTIFIGEMNLNSTAVLTTAGTDAIGTYYPAHWTALAKFPTNEKYLADYKKMWHSTPDIFATNGYEAVMVMGQAIAKAGPPSKYKSLQDYRAAIRNALANIGTIQTVFGNGTMTFVTRKPVLKAWILHVVKGANGSPQVAIFNGH